MDYIQVSRNLYSNIVYSSYSLYSNLACGSKILIADELPFTIFIEIILTSSCEIDRRQVNDRGMKGNKFHKIAINLMQIIAESSQQANLAFQSYHCTKKTKFSLKDLVQDEVKDYKMKESSF